MMQKDKTMQQDKHFTIMMHKDIQLVWSNPTKFYSSSIPKQFFEQINDIPRYTIKTPI